MPYTKTVKVNAADKNKDVITQIANSHLGIPEKSSLNIRTALERFS